MTTTIHNILAFLESKAPPSYKMDFDNVGLLVGDPSRAVDNILLSLDITSPVIDEAIRRNASLIISHHPLFFSLKALSTSSASKTLRLAENKIAAICMHTNLDAAPGGVNDQLALLCGLNTSTPLADLQLDSNNSHYGIGRFGSLPNPLPFPDFLANIARTLNCRGLRYYDAGKPVKHLAVCGGAGADYLLDAFNSGCDTYLTSDIKYDSFLDAAHLAINLIDADHFCTENVVIPVLAQWLKNEFPNITCNVSESHSQTVHFFMPR